VVVGFLALTSSTVLSTGAYQIDSSELTVYRDGVIHVTQILMVNETFPSISLPLVAASVENVMVVDENQTVLDYELNGSNLTVYSLGVQKVMVEYDTMSLTEKEAGVWTIILNTTFGITVHLPEEATIVYLSAMPTSIETVEGRVTLSLPPNEWEISYVLPILGPAVIQVTDLTIDPSVVDMGNKVTISVLVSNIGEGEGAYTAVLNVNHVIVESKTVTLSAGTSSRVEFYVITDEAGTYTVEIGGQEGAFMAEEASLNPALILYPAFIAIGIIAVIYFGVVRRRTISAEKIFDNHPQLRQEDRAVIRFLQERGGKAFESEIRDRFPDLPRTSLWRLIRRLERLEIVSVKKIGLQNLVELK
jgi:uncharacterized membrane protein